MSDDDKLLESMLMLPPPNKVHQVQEKRKLRREVAQKVIEFRKRPNAINFKYCTLCKGRANVNNVFTETWERVIICSARWTSSFSKKYCNWMVSEKAVVYLCEFDMVKTCIQLRSIIVSDLSKPFVSLNSSKFDELCRVVAVILNGNVTKSTVANMFMNFVNKYLRPGSVNCVQIFSACDVCKSRNGCLCKLMTSPLMIWCDYCNSLKPSEKIVGLPVVYNEKMQWLLRLDESVEVKLQTAHRANLCVDHFPLYLRDENGVKEEWINKLKQDNTLVAVGRKICDYCYASKRPTEVICIGLNAIRTRKWLFMLGPRFSKRIAGKTNAIMCRSHFENGAVSWNNKLRNNYCPIRDATLHFNEANLKTN
ncbi:unnamed protein product [Caenorhabditis bovis]|uniref:Uncharacterized protein n=1 Tax=Caenorhabditis bovis TaxID=2654633 RepID=A0A8S1F1C6_9PELO|nr:unnamed protein product [Caenorhabditis bovis]